MKKQCGIYKITSPTGCIYIGQSIKLHIRKNQYKNGFYIGQRKLGNSINKYGWEKHTFEIICECKIEELDYWDADHIIAVCNGGGGLGLSNYRILAKDCHKKKTKSDLKFFI